MVKLTREIKVGIIAVLAVFVLYFGLNFLKGVNIFSPIHYYFTVYENIGGLVPSSPVYVKGMKVGQVEEIQYDFTKEKSFLVKISVNKDVKIPDYAVVQLYDEGIMGAKALQLIYQPYGKTTEMLEPGDTISSSVALGLMGQLAGDLLPKIENIATQTDSLILAVRKIVESSDLSRSLHSIENTTAQLEESSKSINKLLKEDFPEIVKDVNYITGDLKIVSTNLSKVDFVSTMEQVDLTVKDLKIISSQLVESKGTLGLLINDKGVYSNLSNTLANTNELLIDLKSHPKRYVHFSLFGSKNE